MSDPDKERAHLITGIFIDALAPTNNLFSNPVALRQLLDSGGKSFWTGFKHYAEDLAKNGGRVGSVQAPCDVGVLAIILREHGRDFVKR